MKSLSQLEFDNNPHRVLDPIQKLYERSLKYHFLLEMKNSILEINVLDYALVAV